MLVDPGPLVYRGSLTATHTARAVARSNGYTRVISIDIQGPGSAPGRRGSAGRGKRLTAQQEM